MKRINDYTHIEEYKQFLHIEDKFDTKDLEFELFSYEKGEIVASPIKPLEYLLFVVKGQMSIYGIKDSGEMYPVSLTDIGTLLGNCEYCKEKQTTFIVESLCDSLCLALPIEKYKPQLDQDIRFLHTLIDSLFSTHQMISIIDLPSQTLEERLLAYLDNISNKQLESIKSGIHHLHCSRRQLQRVVKKLCDEGILVRTKRGSYKKIL